MVFRSMRCAVGCSTLTAEQIQRASAFAQKRAPVAATPQRDALPQSGSTRRRGGATPGSSGAANSPPLYNAR
jgi:hypothetical protein